MNLFNRLNLVLSATFVTVYALAGLFFYKQIDRQYRHDLAEASERQMQTAQAVRKFTTDHVRQALLQDSREFHPSSVPSFAANQTMQYLQATYPGQSYREVALNPTNRHNLAKGWEVDAIKEFQRTNAASLSTITTDSNGMTLHYAKPIKVNSTTCLGCHGTPDAAPGTMLAKYGTISGFGWQLGETIGAQVVSIPADVAMKRRNDTLLHYLSTSLVLAMAGFGILSIALRQAVVRPMESAGDAWRKLASEDPLTGAANRRSLLDVFDLMVKQACSDHPVSVIFVDIDHFKRINDGPGHQAGDDVLRELTRRIQNTIRRADMLARYGGEEFAILLTDTNEAGAMVLANNLRAALASAPFEVKDQNGNDVSLVVTASFGVTEVEQGEASESALTRADKAVYAAKHRGRDRAVAASTLDASTHTPHHQDQPC
ncbi:diguanylate cyclase [Aquabacterium sp. CECT 9606]|uniref:diguanylate cyclase n=1 Tax=Aquabacterium sp. CECT 9606 TaxID=2845822 RepID=UPI001E575FC6|nr:diguanylate cyclase [Aquabacterium sp. CECT 9606]CAH0356050.1 hypothetical protein AQB9606_04520 [Aquabacterium sp. CECT 9606]